MPLPPSEIHYLIRMKRTSVSELAKKWRVPLWDIYAVINRNSRVVHQHIREKLAAFLEVPVADIGREPRRPQPARRARKAA